MCGIVGLFLKDQTLAPKLGKMLTDMLVTMSDRGPDSAGIAVYGPASAKGKITVQSETPDADFASLADDLGTIIDADVTLRRKDTHAVLELPADKIAAARQALAELNPALRVMSAGDAIEIYKEVGLAQGRGRPL